MENTCQARGVWTDDAFAFEVLAHLLRRALQREVHEPLLRRVVLRVVRTRLRGRDLFVRQARRLGSLPVDPQSQREVSNTVAISPELGL